MRAFCPSCTDEISLSPTLRRASIRVLSSVLRNALEFSARGATIELRQESQADELRLLIRNFGPRIPDYAVPKLFTRFYSLPRPDTGKKGSGLGLPLAKEVMTLHRGRLTVSNLSEQSGVEVAFHFKV